MDCLPSFGGRRFRCRATLPKEPRVRPKKEFLQFLSIARGSLSELETQVIIAKELGYVETIDSVQSRTQNLFKLIGGLVNKLKDRGND